jgi:signal transduction histidine kinase
MKEHILLIEDNMSFRETLSDLLKKEEYLVTGVEDGQQGIKAAKETHFELIVADVRLPGGMDGIEAVAKIKEIRPSAKSIVIIITGYADEKAPLRAIKVGVDDYIYKPFETEEFLYSVERNIKIYRLEENEKRHTETIEKMAKELEDYSRNLEQKVQGRTKELEEANQQLRATQAQLVQSAKMAAIGQLSAGVAHEINNPIGGILGYAQFILDKLGKIEFNLEDFKSCRKYLEYIERESQRCKQIVENLLSFSRKSSEKFEAIDIKSTREIILSLLMRSLEMQNIKITTEYASSLPLALGNTNRLQQVFTDIIINAQQAMPNGGELIISIEAVEKDKKNKLAISFRDTGCGIPQENLERIFEPFFTTKKELKSLGLGLSISYQIIKEHNGEILVTSEVGKGSKFTVLLPCQI